jgi:hypothetical protein
MLSWCTKLPVTHLSFFSFNNYHFTLTNEQTSYTQTTHCPLLGFIIMLKRCKQSESIQGQFDVHILFLHDKYSKSCFIRHSKIHNGKFTDPLHFTNPSIGSTQPCVSRFWEGIAAKCGSISQPSIMLFDSRCNAVTYFAFQFMQKWKECSKQANIHYQIFEKACMSHTISLILSTGA